MKNIIIFGANGMLGKYVSQYFSEQENYNVINKTRKDINLAETSIKEIEANLESYENPVIINCAGAIIQKIRDYGELDMIKVNSVFPWQLAEVCEKNSYKLIHITTDCVFSGLEGMYNEDAIHSPLDVYGKSKSLGEPNYGTIIRTSIIGEELQGKKSFIEWLKSEKGNTVNGYTRNIWNGITCLQFAKICDKVISENLYWNGIRHFNSPDKLNKADMIKVISDIFNLDLKVNDVLLPKQMCDRTVSSKYDITNYNIPTIKDQLIEMKKFKLK